MCICLFTFSWLLLVLCAIGNCLRCDSNVVVLFFERQKLIFIIFYYFLQDPWWRYIFSTPEATSQTLELFISSIISCNYCIGFYKELVFCKLASETSQLSHTLMQYSIYSEIALNHILLLSYSEWTLSTAILRGRHSSVYWFPSFSIMNYSAQLYHRTMPPLAGGNMKLGSMQPACQYRFPHPDYLLQKNRAVCGIIEQVNSLSRKM